MTEYLYRYYKAWDLDVAKAYVERFVIHAESAKTYKIVRSDGHTTFVLKGEGRRYAYPTKELAWDSFQRRLARENTILKQRLELVQAAQALKIEDAVDYYTTTHPYWNKST